MPVQRGSGFPGIGGFKGKHARTPALDAVELPGAGHFFLGMWYATD